MTTYSEVEKYLFGRRRMGMKFGLDRVRSLLADAGDPQRKFRTIHVVGTNGKGSTSALLSEILLHMDYRVGRTNSPHLLCYRERITVDNRWIPESKVVEFVETFSGSIEKHEATFFEITTAMAAWYFAREGIDIAVAEAGLGGRLDATRLFHGEITVFTGVEIEHSRILGSTEPAIASEKVAIAGRDTVLISRRQQADVEEVISLAVGKNLLRRVIPEAAADSPLPGEHQKDNAGLAVAAARLVSDRTAEHVNRAFDASMETLYWPGRLDLREGSPSFLFDVAHSPGSMEYLVDFVRSRWQTPVTAVVGFLEDKHWKEMTRQLHGILEPVVTTTPLNERCLSAGELSLEFQKSGTKTFSRDDISSAMDLAVELTTDLLVVTGSFFVVGEAMLHAWRRGWIQLPQMELETGSSHGTDDQS